MEPCQMFDSMERKIAYDNPIRTNCAKEKEVPNFQDIL